jgi:ketosteroid isomerase-like protein
MDIRTNAQVIHELYDAYVTGNIAAFDAYTDDSVWVEVGRNERTGVYRRKQAILEHGMQLAVLTDGTIATKVEEILPRGRSCRGPRACHGEAKRR